MFTDESYIISCLINRYNHKVFLRENRVFLTSCSLKIDFTDLYVVLFLRTRIFSLTDDITWLFHFKKWFLWMSLSFDILSMNWSIPVWISSRAFSKQICLSSPYFRPLDMSWRSLSLLTIFRFPVNMTVTIIKELFMVTVLGAVYTRL